eukprot:COSAG02_NODE_17_length_55377_cov_106.402258_16_plen_50_part_00
MQILTARSARQHSRLRENACAATTPSHPDSSSDSETDTDAVKKEAAELF